MSHVYIVTERQRIVEVFATEAGVNAFFAERPGIVFDVECREVQGGDVVTEPLLPVDRDDELDCRARLTALGYTVEKAYGALFDEEGVDGWLWFDRHGDQIDYSIGIEEGEPPEIPWRLEAIGWGFNA